MRSICKVAINACLTPTAKNQRNRSEVGETESDKIGWPEVEADDYCRRAKSFIPLHSRLFRPCREVSAADSRAIVDCGSRNPGPQVQVDGRITEIGVRARHTQDSEGIEIDVVARSVRIGCG